MAQRKINLPSIFKAIGLCLIVVSQVYLAWSNRQTADALRRLTLPPTFMTSGNFCYSGDLPPWPIRADGSCHIIDATSFNGGLKND